MIATRSVSFDPYLDDDDVSSLGNTNVNTSEGPALRQGKYSQSNIPHRKTDMLSPQDLDYFFGGLNPDKTKSKTKTKKTKERNKSYSGEIYGRCNRSSLLFRKWTEYTWLFAKPSTLILFGSKSDLKIYQSLDLKDHQKEKLVKFAIDFDASGKLTEKAEKKHKSFRPPPIPSSFKSSKPFTYVVTDVKCKIYKSMKPNLHNFKIIRWNDFDRKTVAAFGSYDVEALKEFHNSLSKCVKRANKASRPKSNKLSIVSREEGSSCIDDDMSVASHNTGVSLWSYYSAGSRRGGKSRSKNKLNKIKVNEQYRQ